MHWLKGPIAPCQTSLNLCWAGHGSNPMKPLTKPSRAKTPIPSRGTAADVHHLLKKCKRNRCRLKHERTTFHRVVCQSLNFLCTAQMIFPTSSKFNCLKGQSSEPLVDSWVFAHLLRNASPAIVISCHKTSIMH